ncbi:hypothetical protein [Spirillospora sp. NPDC047279]|uniref:hypothetical protein n=1 Tax=Spirillospora sp. NPDC047279 TaxID=3155478 RepID=UPI0033FFB108
MTDHDVTEVWVPVAATGAVPVLLTDSRRLVVAFADEAALPPELPPDCAEWQRLPVEQLAMVFPEDVALFLEPGGQIVELGGPRERATALVRAAAGFQRDEIGMPELMEVFRRSVVYCQAPGDPGFLAHAGTVAVFSSLVTLTQALGDTAWFASTGRDVLDQLPAGYELFLDPLTPHATGIPSTVEGAGRADHA